MFLTGAERVRRDQCLTGSLLPSKADQSALNSSDLPDSRRCSNPADRSGRKDNSCSSHISGYIFRSDRKLLQDNRVVNHMTCHRSR